MQARPNAAKGSPYSRRGIEPQREHHNAELGKGQAPRCLPSVREESLQQGRAHARMHIPALPNHTNASTS